MENKWKISKVTHFESDLINTNLRVSPWSGHRNFAYDLVSYLKPKIIVELGTHYGCSFFAFAQAMKDKNLTTELYGVDSWEGEEHAGKYGSEVYNIVNQSISSYFSKQNIFLHKMYFDKALNEFEDNSIDILHIDGLHTYNATKEDFYNYLPKLSENGIVLFHDTADYTKYGSHIFWEEMKNKYRYHFEFTHSWGLGILFPKGNKIYNSLVASGILEYLDYYKYKSEYELLAIKNQDKSVMIEERDKTIKSQTLLIDERDNYIKELENKLDKPQTLMIEERDNYIKELENKLDKINI